MFCVSKAICYLLMENPKDLRYVTHRTTHCLVRTKLELVTAICGNSGIISASTAERIITYN